ncbi:hypothetical protein [Photobacterium phosphoreum]|uniref:hypothetical protein n=1 Tax=Photobacterium phosphoreum TaxID=659 RepID=UPI0011B24FB1|nr:hypothetical protein [Photobacterium phosphoreum]
MSSVCSVMVRSGASQNGTVDFGEYNKATGIGAVTQPFYLYEEGATEAKNGLFSACSYEFKM